MMQKGIDQNEKVRPRGNKTSPRNIFGDFDLLNLRVRQVATQEPLQHISSNRPPNRKLHPTLGYELCHAVIKPPISSETFLQRPRRHNYENDPFFQSTTSLIEPGSPKTQLRTALEKRNQQITEMEFRHHGHKPNRVDIQEIMSSVRDQRLSDLSSMCNSSDLPNPMEAPIRKPLNYSSEYANKATSEILDPELNLLRLGYTIYEPIDWTRVPLPEKRDLTGELYNRIKTLDLNVPDCLNSSNTDIIVHIKDVDFECHLIVLQCYSELFHQYVAIKKIDIPETSVSPESFDFIYSWMIHDGNFVADLTRTNCLEIFKSASYLKIPDLKEQCWAFIDNKDVFNEDTAFDLYVQAKKMRIDDVAHLMLPRIRSFFLILVSSQNWLELGAEDVINLLKSNYIRVNNEMEVFMSAIRWLRYDWAIRDKYKHAIFQKVRFGNIAPWQLVDIKRNAENPEFIEIARDPIICKMIDDGLAYVIIKYWYGSEKFDMTHWNAVLGLDSPIARNYTGEEHTYFTYREFLIYLDENRKTQLIEKSKPLKFPNEIRERRTGDGGSMISESAYLTEVAGSVSDEFLDKKRYRNVSYPNLNGECCSQTELTIPVPPKSFFHHQKRDITLKDSTVFPVPFQAPIIRPPSTAPSVCQSARQRAEEHNNAFQMFTMSKHKMHHRRMNQISNSILPTREKELMSPQSLYLRDRESILIFGGMDPYASYQNEVGRQVFQYLPEKNSWLRVGEMPEPRHHHGIGYLRGRVYIVGGVDPREEEIRGRGFVVNTVWSFDPTTRTWYSETGLHEFRRNFGVVVCNHKMYAIGGIDANLQTLQTMERFDPNTGHWEPMVPMHYARGGHAACKYRDHLWVAGGIINFKDNIITDTVECFSVQNNQWTMVTRLPNPRTYSVFFVLSDLMYIFGGAGITTSDKSMESVGDVYIWDGGACQWVKISNLSIGRHGHVAAYIGTQICVIGGVTTAFMKCLQDVECFCTKRKKWIRGLTNLPHALSGHAVITLPPASIISNI